MANGTIAFDTLQTSGQITGTAKSVDTDYVVNGSAKAWINFNGTGTVAIRESFNVSSLNDDNTGRYTTTFTNNMEDANFVAHSSGNGRGSDNFTYDAGVSIGTGTASGVQVSSSIGMQVSNEGGTSEDITLAMVSVIR